MAGKLGEEIRKSLDSVYSSESIHEETLTPVAQFGGIISTETPKPDAKRSRQESPDSYITSPPATSQQMLQLTKVIQTVLSSPSVILAFTEAIMPVITEKFDEMISMKVRNAQETMSGTVGELSKRVNELETELAKNKEKLQQMEIKLDSIEQYERRLNLRIYGLEESVGENIDEVMMDFVHNKLDLTEMSLSDIQRCHRIGPPGNGKRPIIVRLTSYRGRTAIYRARNKLKGTRIYINEDLTDERAKLAFLARKAKKSRDSAVRDCWTTDGKVLVRLSDQRIREIRSVKDLADM